MQNPQNGTGAAVMRVATGASAEVRWSPELSVTIDGEVIPKGLIANVELHTKGDPIETKALLVFTFMGNPAQMRTALVTRACSSITKATSSDGFVAALDAAV